MQTLMQLGVQWTDSREPANQVDTTDQLIHAIVSSFLNSETNVVIFSNLYSQQSVWVQSQKAADTVFSSKVDKPNGLLWNYSSQKQ